MGSVSAVVYNLEIDEREVSMEKLDKVIAALEQCHRDVKYRDCDRCGYADAGCECERCMMEDALEVIADLKSRLDASKAARLELGRQRRELQEKLEETELTLEVTRMNLGDSREECNRLEDENYRLEGIVKEAEAQIDRLLGELVERRKDVEAQGDVILGLNRDLKRCREALNAQGEYKYLGGDLISREALIERMENIDWYDGKGSHGAADQESAYVRWKDVAEVMEAVLAVESEPVVHAHWVTRTEEVWHLYEKRFMDRHYCSACGDRFVTRVKRCPHCGAHMDEEVAE